MKYQHILKAPKAYWNLDPKEKKKICNGVGPSGWGWLFPETIWGLRITEAANIHDFEYDIGKTKDDQNNADKNFRDNMKAIILHQKSWKWLEEKRLKRARLYYRGVSFAGGLFANKG